MPIPNKQEQKKSSIKSTRLTPKNTKIETKKSGKTVERQALPRTNLPVKLPDDYTLLKQPTMVTLMRSDLSLNALRILLALIEKLQDPMEVILTKKAVPEQLSLFTEAKDTEYIYIPIPIKDFGFTPDRYGELKSALTKMATIPVELDIKDPISGEDSILIKGMFEAIIPKDKYKRTVTLKIDKQTAKHLISVDKGFTKFIKEIAYNAKNKYTVRIYMLISNFKDVGGKKIFYKDFRSLLQLGTKYKEYKDLYKRVIKPAYIELHENADCWFELSEEYKSGEKEPYCLNFKIIRATLSAKDKEALAVRKKNIEGMLFHHFQMTNKEIEDILLHITLENQTRVYERLLEIKGYLNDHKENIADPKKYARSAIMNLFEQTFDDYEEIKSTKKTAAMKPAARKTTTTPKTILEISKDTDTTK